MKNRQLIPIILLSVTLFLLVFACDSGDIETDGDIEIDTDADPDGDDDAGADGDPDADSTDQVVSDGDAEPEEERDAEVQAVCISPVKPRELENQPDETFDLGPYLMQPQQTSIVVMWRTEEEEDGKVSYGVGDSLDSSVSQEGVSNIHEIRLEGLVPDMRYGYQVSSGSRRSAIHHFTTAPDPEQGFNITIWGDSQDNPDIFAQLVDHMVGLNPYFVLGVGDNVSEGGEFPLWKERLFGPARGLFHELGFYTAIGNHARNHQNWYDLMSYPHPDDNPQHESFYSFTYGNAFFLVIDTDKPYFPFGEVDTEISAFVAEQVASPEAQAAKWRFAVSHVPGYAEAWGDAVCESYGGDLAIRGWLYPLLNEYGFHVHFSGHMHGYERGKSDKLITLITGGGGGGLDAWCVDLPQVSVAQYVHHHLHMEVGCDTVRISAYDLDGAMFDWVEISADAYGEIVDEGPMDNLPDPPVDPNSPSLDGDEE